MPELEFSGIVVDSGESSFQIGDEVIGVIPPNFFTSDRGALAQYVLAKVGTQIILSGLSSTHILLAFKSIHLTLKPQSMSWESAAGLSASGITAYRSLFKYYGSFISGQRVFVHGEPLGLSYSQLPPNLKADKRAFLWISRWKF